MMNSFSAYSNDPDGPASQDAVGYLEAEEVLKPDFSSGTGRQLLKRKPAPEVLMGDAALARASIRMSPGALKYRSAVMSFAADDIDVTRFNAGQTNARRDVDTALGLWLEFAFAGIPKSNRPPVFVTTHTHTARLEVNILVPRWVARSDGRIRSYNPDPPGRVSRDGWDAFEDVLNAHFGWNDPRDPARQQLVRKPGWVAKSHAALVRDGVVQAGDIRELLTVSIIEKIETGDVKNRRDVMALLAVECQKHGFEIVHSGPDFVTVGRPGACAKQNIRLSGQAFKADFNSDMLDRSSELNQRLREQRTAFLGTAPERLTSAFERRARFNRSRYGQEKWRVPAFDAQLWLSARSTSDVRSIPLIRVDRSSAALEKTHAKTERPDKHGTTVAHAAGRLRSDTEAKDSGSERQDRGDGARNPSAGSATREFEQHVVEISGPQTLGRLLTTLARRVQRLVPNVVASVALNAVRPKLSAHLSKIRKLADSLEALNDTLEKQHRRLTTSLSSQHSGRVRHQRNAEDSDRNDRAVARASGDTRKDGGELKGRTGKLAHELGQRRRWADKDQRSIQYANDNRSTVESTERTVPADRENTSTTEPEYTGNEKEIGHADALVCDRPPHGSRAELIAAVQATCAAEDRQFFVYRSTDCDDQSIEHKGMLARHDDENVYLFLTENSWNIRAPSDIVHALHEQGFIAEPSAPRRDDLEPPEDSGMSM
jgi:hypothetical protein